MGVPELWKRGSSRGRKARDASLFCKSCGTAPEAKVRKTMDSLGGPLQSHRLWVRVNLSQKKPTETI